MKLSLCFCLFWCKLLGHCTLNLLPKKTKGISPHGVIAFRLFDGDVLLKAVAKAVTDGPRGVRRRMPRTNGSFPRWPHFKFGNDSNLPNMRISFFGGTAGLWPFSSAASARSVACLFEVLWEELQAQIPRRRIGQAADWRSQKWLCEDVCTFFVRMKHPNVVPKVMLAEAALKLGIDFRAVPAEVDANAQRSSVKANCEKAFKGNFEPTREHLCAFELVHKEEFESVDVSSNEPEYKKLESALAAMDLSKSAGSDGAAHGCWLKPAFLSTHEDQMIRFFGQHGPDYSVSHGWGLMLAFSQGLNSSLLIVVCLFCFDTSLMDIIPYIP